MPTPTPLYRFDPSKILQPAQGEYSAQDAGVFGPNVTFYSGQAAAVKTADGKLYPYTTNVNLNTSQPSITATLAPGGSLIVGTYYYKATALYGSRETNSSSESTVVTAVAGNQSSTITVSVPATGTPTGYNIYRTAVNGSSGSETFLVTVPAGVTTITDSGTYTGSATTPPTAGSAVTTDGTQTAVALSKYGFVTDSTGQCYAKFATVAGTPVTAVSSFIDGPCSTMPFYYKGVFDPRELLGVDANALTALQAKTLPDGNISIP